MYSQQVICGGGAFVLGTGGGAGGQINACRVARGVTAVTAVGIAALIAALGGHAEPHKLLPRCTVYNGILAAVFGPNVPGAIAIRQQPGGLPVLGDGLRIARVKGNQAPAFGAALALAPIGKGWQRRLKCGHFQRAEAGRHHAGFAAPNVQVVHVELAAHANASRVKIGIAVIAAVVGDLHSNVRCGVESVDPTVLGVLAARADVAAASL